jgi:hypothetical protein
MTDFTPELKVAIKKEAKDLQINVVGKSMEKLLDLIDEKTGRTRELTLKVLSGDPITDTDVQELLPQPKKPADNVRELAKVLGIPFSGKTERAQLVQEIAKQKGWENETPEVIEFLIGGGSISEVPGFTAIAPKPNNRETSAGGKVEPVPEKAKKTPRKISKTEGEPKAPKASAKSDGSVTLAGLLEELGVEGRVARRKLRGSDIQKPGDSWSWEAGHADIQRVRDLLKK